MLGKTTAQCSAYRDRLIKKRILVADGRNFIRLGLPYCQRYFEGERFAEDVNREWCY